MPEPKPGTKTELCVVFGNRRMQQMMRGADVFEDFKYLAYSIKDVHGVEIYDAPEDPDEAVDRFWKAVEADEADYPIVVWDSRAPERVRCIPGMEVLSDGKNWATIWDWCKHFGLQLRPELQNKTDE